MIYFSEKKLTLLMLIWTIIPCLRRDPVFPGERFQKSFLGTLKIKLNYSSYCPPQKTQTHLILMEASLCQTLCPEIVRQA
jgi:hypothetical protein